MLGIGIDTGGTYTDAVVYDFEKEGVLAKGKTLTTKEDLSIGIGNALDALPRELLRQARLLSLSTTLSTNACVENKGGRAKLVLVGLKSKALERANAKMVYGLNSEEVLCIDTKSSFDGKVIDNPDWDSLAEVEHEWFSDAQALAVAEVNSTYTGAVCEKSAKEKLAQKYAVPFVMASELAAELNVMERGATALLNARLLPIIEEFMVAVKTALSKRKLDIKEMIVRSDGSLMSEEWALKHPVKTILSGPAASIIGGRGLTQCTNSLIVDMGGTTTDISIVKNGEPAMTDGIRIGGFRTQIKGVFIDTFGLGGDSRIMVQDNQIVLDTRRVQPLCVAATLWPQIKDALQTLVAGNKTSTAPLHEFLYLVKEPQNGQNYTAYEIDLIQKLQEHPIMLGSGEIDLYNLKSERLEKEGIVMRCGLTPTDIMHIKGDFCRHDKTASALGAKYLLKILPEYEDTDSDLQRLCEDIYDLVCRKLYENIVRVMMINQYPSLFEKGISDQLTTLIRQSWYEQSQAEKRFFGLAFDTQAVLVGIGAPTHIFLPAVAKALGTQWIIPQHAEVANAVGAIIADISVELKVKIDPNYTVGGITGYTVYSDEGQRVFDTLEEATHFAKESAIDAAVSAAKKRGALGELSISTQVQPKIAYAKEGMAIDLGTTVVARASGHFDPQKTVVHE